MADTASGNEMVERVAKALYEHATGAALGWELTNPEPWWKAARAAIAAMREPTEAMISAADFAGPERYSPDGVTEAIWPAMIDAALSDSQT